MTCHGHFFTKAKYKKKMTTNQDLKISLIITTLQFIFCMAENVLMITRIDFIIYHSEFSLSIKFEFCFFVFDIV